MGDEFTHQILRMVVGRICQPLGWHAMNSNAGDALADIMKHYMMTLAKTTAAYSSHDNRTEPNLIDLSRAFKDLGVSLPELAEFVDQVNSAPLDQRLPLYPIPQNSTHIHVHQSDQSEPIVHKKLRSGSSRSCSTSEDSSDELEYIPSYLPSLPALKGREKDDDAESGIHLTGEHNDLDPMDTSNAKTPTPLTPHDPARGLPQLVRPRGFSSDFSEDGEGGGSRRNSVSESTVRGTVSEGAPIRTPDFVKHLGDKVRSDFEESERKKGNIFEAAFRKELSKSDVTHGNVKKPDKPVSKLGKLDSTPVAAKPPLPPLRLMNTSNESSTSVYPTQQPPLSPLLRSPPNIHSIRQGLPILSPLRTPTSAPRLTTLSGIVSPPMHPPTLKFPLDNTLCSSVIPIGAQPNVPIKAPRITPITAHPVNTQEPLTQARDLITESQYYPVPGSPQKVQLREFHVSAEKLPVSRRSKSMSLTPPPPDVASPSRDLDAGGVAYEGETPDISSPDSEKLVTQSPKTEQFEEKQSGASPVPSSFSEPLQEANEDQTEPIEDLVELKKASKESPLPNYSVEDLPGERIGVGLEESLSRLSDSESSIEPEEIGDGVEESGSSLNDTVLKKEIKNEEVCDESEKLPSSLSSTSPVSSPVRPLLLSQPESELVEEDSNLEQVGQEKRLKQDTPLQSSDTETPMMAVTSNVLTESQLSEDNLSISANGSDSETDSKYSPPPTARPHDFNSDIDSPADAKQKSEPISPNSFSEVFDQKEDENTLKDELSPAALSPPAFQEVSAYSEVKSEGHSPSDRLEGGHYSSMNIRDESDEIINTSSAQKSNDFTDLSKVSEAFSSDEDVEEVPKDDSAQSATTGIEDAFPGGNKEKEKESSEETCLVVTSTEKVKGETKGRRRTVSRDDVLGIRRPKKVAKPRKGGATATTEATPTAMLEPLPTSLMVSIKKSVLDSLQQSVSSRRTSTSSSKTERIVDIPVASPQPPITNLPPHAMREPPITNLPPHSMREPLLISINRRLLRYSKYDLTTPTPEEKPRPAFAEMLKIRLSRFGAQGGPAQSMTIKPPRTGTDATPIVTPPTGSRTRELEVSPDFEFVKRPRLETQVEATQLSSSSTSSSSDDDSASESLSCTPSPHHPSHILTPTRTDTPLHTSHVITPSHTDAALRLPRTPSSVEEDDDDSSTPSSASSVSGLSVAGGGLKLTISKAVLQQARAKPSRSTSRERGPSGWTPVSTGRRPRKSQPTKFTSQATPIAMPTPRLLDVPAGKSRQKRGAKTIKKQTAGSGLFIQSSDQVALPPPLPTTFTPSVGSNTICPKCNQRDDGSPMIGCDNCDDWFHWRCVGVTFEPPSDEKWFCLQCETTKKGKKKSRKRKR